MQKEIIIELIKFFKIPFILFTIYFVITPVDRFVEPITNIIKDLQISEVKLNDFYLKFKEIDKGNKNLDLKLIELRKIAREISPQNLDEKIVELQSINKVQKKELESIKTLTIGPAAQIVGIIAKDGTYTPLP